MFWSTFLAIFSQDHLVTLLGGLKPSPLLIYFDKEWRWRLLE
jgi:hypothetical protein